MLAKISTAVMISIINNNVCVDNVVVVDKYEVQQSGDDDDGGGGGVRHTHNSSNINNSSSSGTKMTACLMDGLLRKCDYFRYNINYIHFLRAPRNES